MRVEAGAVALLAGGLLVTRSPMGNAAGAGVGVLLMLGGLVTVLFPG